VTEVVFVLSMPALNHKPDEANSLGKHQTTKVSHRIFPPATATNSSDFSFRLSG